MAALRSGEFKQRIGILHDTSDETYCCLGVACVLYQREFGDLVVEEDSGFFHSGRSHTRYDDNTLALPEKVQEWLGLASAVGELTEPFEGDKALISLANVNDCGRYNFEHIANLIESGQVKMVSEPWHLLQGTEEVRARFKRLCEEQRVHL